MNKNNRELQLILFIVISYAHLWLLFGIGRLFDIQFSYNPAEPGGILVLIGVPASLIAVSFVTLITTGKEELRQLFRHSLEWRFAPWWYLASLLTPLLVAFVSGTAAVWINKVKIADNWFSPSMPLGFMVFLLVYIGVGEEIGWRGFALPRFQRILGPLGGSIATGVFWALWHLPLFLMPGSSQYGNSLITFIYLLTCWTIPMAVFVGKSRGSVIPAILFHGSVNFLAFAIYYPYRYFYLFWGIAAIIGAVFLLREKSPMGKRSGLYERSDI
ncbi:MAG TPA: CPBP family intramembrane metalloprotease [Syntrophales bacterium]|nr:CPBP family intramembrane metalloprotease [Syntrophales bacterium]